MRAQENSQSFFLCKPLKVMAAVTETFGNMFHLPHCWLFLQLASMEIATGDRKGGSNAAKLKGYKAANHRKGTTGTRRVHSIQKSRMS